MSLRIIINNQEARLPESCEIELKLSNTFFNDREEDATYPLTLNIPANRHIFNLSDRFNSDDFIIKYPAKVYFGPYCLLDGHCIVTDISGSEIEVFITTDNTSLWGVSKTTYLNKLNLGEERFSSIDSMMTAFTESLSGGKDYVVCPLSDPYMSKIYTFLHKTFYNYFPWDVVAAFDPGFKHEIPEIENGQVVFTPFIRLNALIKKVFAALGYQIILNDIANDTDFNDILVMCRANGKNYDSHKHSFPWNERVPHILVSDFLQEIENKFGCQIRVNESSKTVSIISDISGGADIHVVAHDLLQKYSIDSEDQKQDFVFKDKDNPDTHIQHHYDDGNLQHSIGSAEDAESIECISTIVGHALFNYVAGFFNYNIYHSAVDATYEDDATYLATVRSEFRLAVYRGQITCNENNGLLYQSYPIATAEPPPSNMEINDMSLLWDGTNNNLYEKYHDKRIEFIQNINREYQFILKHSMNDLINFHNYFSSCLIIRNQRYRCYEINIKLSNTKIVEHIVKCYPA